MARRNTLRCPYHDYSSIGFYFITTNVKDGEHLFGEIVNDMMYLNEFGRIVYEEWTALINRYPAIDLDKFQVMPDHFHGIIQVRDSVSVGAIHESPLPQQRAGKIEARDSPDEVLVNNAHIRRKMTIPKAVGRFKMRSAKRINKLRNTKGAKVWQRNYFDRIIRSYSQLEKVRDYIKNNPKNYQSKDDPDWEVLDLD